MADIEGLLRTILTRIDGLETKVSNLSLNGGGDESSLGEELPKSIKAFDAYVRESVDPFMAAANALGDDAAVFGSLTGKAWDAMRSFLLMASFCKEPAQAEMPGLLKDVIAAMKAVDPAIKRNDFELHGKVCKEAVSTLNWLVIKPAPRDFVESSVGGCDLHANKIRVQYKGKDDRHIAFCNTQKAIVTGLMDYIKEYHTTGVRWNRTPSAIDAKDYTPGAAPAAPAPASAPAASPADAVRPAVVAKLNPAVAAAGAGDAAKVNLFAALNKGTGITSGLKTVTKDQQTWRSEYKGVDDASAPKPAPAPKPAAKFGRAAANAGPKGPSKKEYNEANKSWLVEYQAGQCEVVCSDPKAKIMVYGCVGATVHIKGKCRSLLIDACKKTTVYFDSVLGACEVVNCGRMNVHVLQSAPTVSIDTTDGIVLHLSETAIEGLTITTSKSSEMNVSWIDNDTEDKELVERPIPEQYTHTVDIKAKRVTAEVSDLYSH